jgi:23S rRNA (uracil1939-C5)-methyltransferase
MSIPGEATEAVAANLCPHFGECGGCSIQNVPYSEQLTRKQSHLRGLFQEYWSGPIPVEPSPTLWHYRNRVDLVFARKQYAEPPPKNFERETVLGFKREGKWFWTLDIQECRIGPRGLSGLMDSARRWARERYLKAWTSKSKDGFLRVLLVREGKRTGERMVVLITAEGSFDPEPFVEAVQSTFPCTSIYRGVLRGKAEITGADELQLLHGSPVIHEELRIPDGDRTRNLKFRISPFSFFQTNSAATEVLYGVIRDWVKQIRPHVLYDLYGGAGGIALACADHVDRVVSVESNEAASVDGGFNEETNGIDNVVFVTQPVEVHLRDTLHGPGAFYPRSLVVLDPPRSGVHPKALKRLLTLRPPTIIYVSCKPAQLAAEMKSLAAAYEIRELRAVDLFPHTDHVELLARLVSRT